MEITAAQEKKYWANLKTAARDLQKVFPQVPEFAVVFGSGLGECTLRLGKPRKSISYHRISHFPGTTVAGHHASLHYLEKTRKNGSAAIILQGRQHYYEGASPQEIVFPIRALRVWGVRRILLTNASGALLPKFKPGSLMMIRDHINVTSQNPLRGPNLESLGPRFPSMIGAYQGAFAKKIAKVGKSLKIHLPGGVYVGTLGPSYETPAELKAFKRMGGDVVGMSTVLEAIAAVHGGMDLAALSAVTNVCIHPATPPNHEEVLREAQKADKSLAKIILKLLGEPPAL